MPGLVSFKVDISGFNKMQAALLKKIDEINDTQIAHDVVAWPAAVQANYHYMSGRPHPGASRVMAAMSAKPVALTNKKGVGLYINQTLAPHWKSLEYGSIETPATVRTGELGYVMRVRPGWVKQVRMVGRVVYGRFTPGAPFPVKGSRAAQTIVTKGGLV